MFFAMLYIAEAFPFFFHLALKRSVGFPALHHTTTVSMHTFILNLQQCFVSAKKSY